MTSLDGLTAPALLWLMQRHKYPSLAISERELDALKDSGFGLVIRYLDGKYVFEIVQEPIPYEEYKAAAGVKEDVQSS